MSLPYIKPTTAFKYRDLRLLLTSVSLGRLSLTAMLTMLAFRIYDLTGSKSALGTLGLAEAIPALALLLLGGHWADSGDRKRILLGSSGVWVLSVGVMAAFCLQGHESLALFYITVVIMGFMSGINTPAMQATESQVLPVEVSVAASGLIGGIMSFFGLLGPALGGLLYDRVGSANGFAILTGGLLLSHLALYPMGHYSARKPELDEPQMPLMESISQGWRYVRGNQVLFGAMCLDLFAVLFGGAVAMIPVFAKDILHVDKPHAGYMASATSAGALIGMLLSVRVRPAQRAGRNLLLAVGGFGVSILVFAFSKNYWLSLAALMFSGVFDGFSMIIRRVLFRTVVPNELRGRVGSVNMMFIGASNEIGAAESGYAAQLLGTVPSVAAGGILCLCVVGVASFAAKELRNFRVDPATAAK
ncbi:MAG: MFS transporter [Armatimonadetes bacterium]|nr:MFS transporter [Armatimonadota bacterium]